MLQNTRSLFGVAVALVCGAAFATHPVTPLALQQKQGTTVLAAGTIIPTGSSVDLYSDVDSSTCGGNYVMEYEVQPTSTPFSNTPNYFSAPISTSCSQVTAPATTLSNLPAGNYHWQVRLNTGCGTTCLSGFAQFNAGSTAFGIAPPNTPDILVQNVTLNQTVPDPMNNTLSFNIDATFEDRGTVAAGPFTWKAYLSTDKVLQVGTDQLIFTSTTPITVPATSTLVNSSGTVTLNPRPPPGAYYIIVEADPAPQGCTMNCGTVNEFDETNNTGSTPNYFVNGIDYVASSISNGPTAAGPGTQITLTPNFFNQGIEGSGPNGTPGTVEFAIYASRDKNWDSSDQEIQRVTVNNFGGAQTFNSPQTITLPTGIAGGDVYWILKVDPPTSTSQNPTVEALETNNEVVSAASTHITQADLQADFADLVDKVTGQSVRTADFGQQARFQVQAENIGDFAAPPSSVGVILSTDNTLSLISDTRIDDVQVASLGVAPNNKTTYDITVTLPTMLKGKAAETGDYFFFLQLDSFNVINELSESNNVKVVVGPVRIRTPNADYAVLKVQAPAAAAGGETIALTRTFANIGTDNGAATTYRCFASVNSIITTGDYPLDLFDANGMPTQSKPLKLDVGQQDAATEQARLPGSMTAGNYYVGCIVDPDQQVTELDETNNARSTSGTIAVSAQNFRVVTAQLPDATLGMPYSFKLATTGALGTPMWSATSMPPEGLGLQADGTLTGTPTKLGVTTFNVQATSGNAAATAVLVQRVLPPSTQLTITTDNLPPVINSTSIPYQGALSASGGAAPYTWSLVSGLLPGGITLDASTGLLAGTPKPGVPTGETKLKVQVRDSLGGTVVKDMKIRVLPQGALQIVTLAAPDSLVNTDYLTDFAAQIVGGGSVSKPLVWSVVSGQLPPGLDLETHTDGATGLLSGKATVAGTYAFTVQVQDNDGRADTSDYIIRIYTNALKVVYATTPQAVIHPGDEVDFAVTTSGTGAVNYRLYSGALPPGLSLDATGKVTGTIEDADTSVGVHSFVIEATDAAGAKGLGAFNVEVTAKPKAQGCGSSATGTGPFSIAALLALALAAALRRRTAR